MSNTPITVIYYGMSLTVLQQQSSINEIMIGTTNWYIRSIEKCAGAQHLPISEQIDNAENCHGHDTCIMLQDKHSIVKPVLRGHLLGQRQSDLFRTGDFLKEA